MTKETEEELDKLEGLFKGNDQPYDGQPDLTEDPVYMEAHGITPVLPKQEKKVIDVIPPQGLIMDETLCLVKYSDGTEERMKYKKALTLAIQTV